jgi:hypothetical protein
MHGKGLETLGENVAPKGVKLKINVIIKYDDDKLKCRAPILKNTSPLKLPSFPYFLSSPRLALLSSSPSPLILPPSSHPPPSFSSLAFKRRALVL